MEKKIGFGGGCHWCTEAVFASLKGVKQVDQGFIKSIPPFDTYSEAVVVTFNPAVIPLHDLIEIHLRTHSSASIHAMRKKYRSAVYYFTHQEKEETKNIFELLQPQFEHPVITELLPFVQFKPSLPQYANYYYTNPQKPFCELYIHPKLQWLKQNYVHFMNMQEPD